jgi:hypothetical protein
MTRQSAPYSIGRACSVLFISLFLGGVWGVTAVAVLGIVAYSSRLGETGWHLLTGATLLCSLWGVWRVAAHTPQDADAIERKSSQTDKFISAFSFAAAYIAIWVLIRFSVIDIIRSIVM